MRHVAICSFLAVGLLVSPALNAQEYAAKSSRQPQTTRVVDQGWPSSLTATLSSLSGRNPAPVAPATFQVNALPQVGALPQASALPPLEAEVPAEDLTNCYDFCACNYVQVDGVYWHRVGTGCDQVLVTNAGLPAGSDTVLRTSDFHFGGTGGVRVLVGLRPDPACCPLCSAWELSYWGIFGLNAQQTVTDSAGNLAIPGDLGLASNNFTLTNILDVNYQSQLNNVELNCVKSCFRCCDQIDFLCGFRYLNLSETVTITGTDFQEGRSTYQTHTDNNLFGVQLGGRYERQLSAFWFLQLVAKSGVFLNAVHQSQQATDYPTAAAPFSLRDRISASGSAVATLGELNVIFIRWLNDTWSLRLGYTAMGIGGLALATDQLDFTDTFSSGSHLQKTGWVFIQGGLVGLESRW